MGGMAAQIPIKEDPERNRIALERVRADKLREVESGHDGTWVAHPGLVPIAREVFDTHMPRPHQMEVLRGEVHIAAEDLLAVPQGSITFAGLRQNLCVGLRYLEAWLSGNGCVPLFDLMEDAATAEISRAQVWQWRRHGRRLADGRPVDAALVESTLRAELEGARTSQAASRVRSDRFELAASILRDLILRDELEDFLTLAAYRHL
jgi:malate synthase